ncbi:cysteine--tRNA ligase [Candidatus Daviesbacteria bacterium]|nr:cysteine--tRNA ligase [Candidatus Daviesbacteria bacterium]
MKLYNSLTNSKDEFKPLEDKRVTIYVCGITPYDTTHLGHAFTYISFDALIRYLKFKGFKVIYTQNVTDINDKDKDILARAKKLNVPWDKLADYWTKHFLEDMKKLNWLFPDYYLKASEQILCMIQLIQRLLDNGLTYQIGNSVYLDISKDKDYGKLSKYTDYKKIKFAKKFEEDLVNPDKRNPLDITLWRGSTPNQSTHIPIFKSPFGPGRPGWHIECSAMGISTLGEQIDIHGGGKDLIFPHHEAEIAQSEGATGKIPFVKYWLHTGTVFYQGKKMSKSEGNLVMVADLVKKYSPNAIRWLLLSNHWAKSWEYIEEDLKKAQENVNLVENVILASKATPESKTSPKIKQFMKILDNNFYTPKALEFLLKLAKDNLCIEVKGLYEMLGFYL